MQTNLPILPSSLNLANRVLMESDATSQKSVSTFAADICNTPNVQDPHIEPQKAPTTLSEFFATLTPRERSLYYKEMRKMTLDAAYPETQAVLDKVDAFRRTLPVTDSPFHRPHWAL